MAPTHHPDDPSQESFDQDEFDDDEFEDPDETRQMPVADEGPGKDISSSDEDEFDDLFPSDEELAGDDFAKETRMMQIEDLQDLDMLGPAGKLPLESLPEDLEPSLLITAGPGTGMRFVIEKPMVILGRVEEVADIVITDDAASRHHAVICHQHGTFVLYDIGSTNGTYVEERRVSSATLSSGTQIRIGETVLTFHLDLRA